MTIAIRIALVAAVSLAMSGCAGMYGGIDGGKRSLNHIGAVKRGDNLYDVVYIGKDTTTADYRRDMAMLESAELCKARGFGWFKASDTSAWTTFAPETSPAEQPQLTLQVSCFDAEDAANITYGVETVIDRVTAIYSPAAMPSGA